MVRCWAFVEKQKQTVWLTAQDNVKGLKTYTITGPFFAEHSVFWVTVMLSNKVQVCHLWNQHPLTSNVCTIHWSDKDINTYRRIYSLSCFPHFLQKIEVQSVNYSLSGSILVWSNIWYLAKLDKPQVSQKWGKPLKPGNRQEDECEEILSRLASVRNDSLNSPKANHKLWICRDLSHTPVVWSTWAHSQLMHDACS